MHLFFVFITQIFCKIIQNIFCSKIEIINKILLSITWNYKNSLLICVLKLMDACYCGKKLTFVESKTSFKCFSCQTFYHAGLFHNYKFYILSKNYLIFLACLKIQLPSQILGDIFYDFTCLKCAKKFGANSESLKRIKLSW